MVTRLAATVVYSLFAIGAIGLGGTVLLFRAGILPVAITEKLLAEAQGSLHTLHIMQEFSSLLVFAGVITLWFVRHYEKSRAFHWALTGFWTLFALVHWFDVRHPLGSVAGPLVNTVPAALFLAIGLLREREAAKGHRATGGAVGKEQIRDFHRA
jgi:hypothetical protein